MASLSKVKNDLIIRAVNAESQERAPVWMMRQAGRYLPEYRAVREEAGSFLNLCKNPDKAAEVSLQPYERFNVDAIIMFSDILVIPEAVGAELSFGTGGPKFAEAIRSEAQIKNLLELSEEEILAKLDYVFGTLKEILKRVDSQVPVFGFAGAPFTLATYMIEGGSSKNFENTKQMMYAAPELFDELLSKLANAVSKYLILKLKTGAAMVQLFDTWASILDAEDFERFAGPWHKKIFADIKTEMPEAKVSLYINGVANVFDQMIDSGADMLSIDWRMDLASAFKQIQASGKKISLQGNLDPCVLLGEQDLIKEKTTKMLEIAAANINSKTGYVANLGHGIIPQVPPENARVFIETVQGFKF